MPAVGYDNSNQSHFTARHYYEVGATDANLRTGWLGRYLDQVGTHGQPAAGADARHRDASFDRDREGAGRDAGGAPTSTPFAPPGIAGASARGVDPAGGGEHRRGAREVRPIRASRPAGATAYDSHHLYYGLGNLPSTASTARSPTRARPIPFPHRLAGLAAMLAAGLPVRVVGLTVGHFDTHADAGGHAAARPPARLRLAARVPARPRGARDRRPRAGRTSGRSSAAAAPRTRPAAPTTARRGIGFLIGSKLKGQQIGSHPGHHRRARRAGQPQADRGLPRRLRERCSSSGSTPTRTRSSRACGAFARPALLK